MSAESLHFLGYEDMEDFISMHDDFATLLVKKEGYIHNFDNFSWIHYVLYSGTANKQAIIAKKNGQEIPVNISIKEVFLNQEYNGVSKLYSVKIIHENFTLLSTNNDANKNMTPQTNISLRGLAGVNTAEYNQTIQEQSFDQKETTPTQSQVDTKNFDLKLDLEQQSPLDTAENLSTQTPKIEDSKVPEDTTLDFKLDLPESFQSSHEQTSAEIPLQPESNLDFKLDETTIQEKEDTLELPQLNPDVFMQTDTQDAHEEKSESSERGLLNIFGSKKEKTKSKEKGILDLAALLHPKSDKTPTEEKIAKDTPQTDSSAFSFKLLDGEKTEDIEPAKTSVQEDIRKDQVKDINEPTLSDISISTSTPKEEDFLFNLSTLEDDNINKNEVGKETPKEENIPAHVENKPEGTNPFHADTSLIAQIKDDIEEIDQTPQKQNKESDTNTLSLDMLLKSSENSETKEDAPLQEKTDVVEEKQIQQDNTLSLADLIKPNDKQDEEVTSQIIEQKTAETNKDQKIENICDNRQLEIPDTSRTFSKTLEDVFTLTDVIGRPQKNENSQLLKDESENLLTQSLNLDSLSQVPHEDIVQESKNQQDITKDTLKSENKTDVRSIELPTFEGLGLNKEDEFELINEFLDDTNQNLQMIEAYSTIDDFHNVKYNLIKIKSSAEILNLDSIIDITKAMLTASDTKNSAEFSRQLDTLKHHIAAYKDHFAAISA